MKKNSASQSAFFNPRVLIGFIFCLAGVFLALLGFGAFSNVFAQAKGTKTGPQTNPSNGTQAPFGPPDVVQMVGPVAQNQDLRSLPYIPPNKEVEERRLTRYPHPETGSPERQGSFPLIRKLLRPAPTMPLPLLTFDGMNSAQSGCGCLPPDSEGDVGPNHYVNAVNTSIKIFDKSGNPLNGPNGTTFNSFFAPLTGTPCNSQNDGDPFVLYDQMADRWVVSDFAFPSFPGTSFYQCIGVSQTGDPVSGGWFLYALQVDPANPTFLGDYPKFALWPDAYYLTMNLFSSPTTFNGVRVYALDRNSMIAGGPTNAIGFTLTAGDVGASYSFVAASFRAGDPPPAGRQEFVLAVDSPASGGVTLTQVHGRLFHVDFANPNNSIFGVGQNHLPNAEITVNGFVDAFTNTTTLLVPQQGTSAKLDTLGDKIMTPAVYQNRSGTESLWASQTVCTDQNCTGPTAIRWYQFDVTGGTFSATPVQQQSWTNGGDGLWRWMPSIAVDQNGNAAIGYSTSSASIFPSIRYAGRLAGDPLNDLGQGEAIMTNGGGSQTSGSGRWGDYSMLTIDPADNASFWHVNEYYVVTSSSSWATRIAKFRFSPPARYDFNGDGFPDYLLFNASTRQTAIWYLQGTTFLSGAYGPTLPAGWVVACVADMNLDGKPDYVLFNPGTRQTAIWYLNGVTLVSGAYGPTLPPGWTLIDAVDFNSDGKPDYVLFNPGTRQTAIWYLNGVTLVSGTYGPTLPSGWTLIDAVDFNSDGKPDYVLVNPGARQTAIWYLNGVTLVRGAYGPTLPSGWTLKGAVDFNSDGKPDYVLVNPCTRQTAIWYLNGVTLVRGAYGPTLPSGYSLAAP